MAAEQPTASSLPYGKKLHRFGLQLHIGTTCFRLPRKNNRWIMAVFEESGYSIDECIVLNEVRLHQQVVYESDIFNVDDRTLNKRYLSLRQSNQTWSSYQFSLKRPTFQALELWREALSQIAPGGRRHQGLGNFQHQSHILWKWKYDVLNDLLYHENQCGITRFRKTNGARRAQHSLYSSDGLCEVDTSELSLCSILHTPDQSVSLLSSTPRLHRSSFHQTFAHSLPSGPTNKYGPTSHVPETTNGCMTRLNTTP
jgi:hypothetical protein